MWDENSKILILGSFPSVKSRESKFFYGYPQNRFWKVLSRLFDEKLPNTINEKRQLLIVNHIAVWDVIASCDISGSSDSSIKNVVPNDISKIIELSRVTQIFVNGSKAESLYKKYIYPDNNILAIKLPSTSPANAKWTEDKLVSEWSVIKKYL